jgi:hypothetical protein
MVNNTSWNDVRDSHRSDWERNNPGKRWDNNVEHGYRYGWESGQDQRFGQHRSFDDAEGDLRQGWTDYDHTTHGSDTGTQLEHAWDDFKDSVRHGWERAKQEFTRRT